MGLTLFKQSERRVNTGNKAKEKLLKPHLESQKSTLAAKGKSKSARAVPTSGCDPTIHLQMWTLQLPKEAKQLTLKEAKLTGWLHADIEQGTAEHLIRPASGAEPNQKHVILLTAPYVLKIQPALAAANAMKEVKKADYKAQLLQVPAADVMALWLHGKSADFLLPLQSPNQFLFRAAKPIFLSSSEFLNTLAEYANQRSKFNNKPGTQ